MRTWLVIIAGIICGCFAGFAKGWYGANSVIEYFEPASRNAPVVDTVRTDMGGPRVVVEGGTKFDFGTILSGSEGDHTFIVRNEGDSTLEIEFSHPSCGKCIESHFTSAKIPPGGSHEVEIHYGAKKEGTNFHESAYIKTNDPVVSLLRLDITGTVTRPIELSPQDLTLGSVSASEGTTATLRLLGFRSPKLEITETKFSNPSTSSYFEITSVPLTPDEVTERNEHATCGLELTMKLKPGLPLGPLSQIVTFVVQADIEHQVEARVSGDVVGDITLMGQLYDADTSMVRLGVVPRDQGAKSTVHLLVKGPHRKDVELTVKEVWPPGVLDATFGNATPIAEGKTIKHPLNIEVKKGADVQTHFGDARGKLGKIIIETTHPTAKRVQVYVRFAVE